MMQRQSISNIKAIAILADAFGALKRASDISKWFSFLELTTFFTAFAFLATLCI